MCLVDNPIHSETQGETSVVTLTPEELLIDGTVSVKQAMAFANFSREYLYKLMRRRDLPYVQAGRVRRIPRRALIQFLARNLHA